MWNAATKCEKSDGITIYADLCCLSHDGHHVGVLRRHDNGYVIYLNGIKEPFYFLA